MILYIAEKPSLGRAIADVLPKPHRKEDGCIRLANGDVVSWCIGHLLELAEPEHYDERYQKWRVEDLPIVPSQWEWVPKKDTRKQLTLLRKLIKEADEIVHAGDPDREGQLLVDEVIQYLKVPAYKKDQAKRLLISDLNPSAVKKALHQLRFNREFIPLSTSALARSRADWMYGMNMTRLCTVTGRQAGYNGVLSVGRVQTPVLGLVVERDQTIENFVSKPFYEVWAHMDFLRMESEMNYLSMLPEEVRDEKVRFWYRDALDDIEPYLNVLKHAGVPALVKTRGPDHTFALEASLRSHLADAVTNPFDLGKSPLTDETKQWLKRLFNLKGTPATLLPESVLILVETNQGNDTVLSLTSDSAYFNISSMFDEDDRRARNEDKITVGHGIISPYPDAIFHIKEADIPDFVESLSNVIDEAQYSRLLDRFGVRRNAPEFWSISDRIHAWYAKDQPLTSGLLDYNRLDNR